MNTFDKTAASQTTTIRFEFDLRHPPKKVWRALTDRELLREWLLPVVGDALGPRVAFMFKTDPHPGWDGVVNCRVIDFEPEHKISYAWTVPFLNTVVTFTLTPTTAGTLLTLEQSGFLPEQKQAFGGARYGWNMMGSKLIQVLDQHT